MKNNNILIVEDEELLANVLRDRLEKDGYNVTIEKNGETGLEAAKTSKIDLIVTDILLPKVDGVSMIKEIRTLQQYKNTPIIVLTNLERVTGTEELVIPPRDLLLKKTYLTLSKVIDIIKNKLPIS